MIKNFLRDESGASAAEYALILAVVGAGIAAAAYWLGDAVETSVDNATLQVEACAPGAAGADNSGCEAYGDKPTQPTA